MQANRGGDLSWLETTKKSISESILCTHVLPLKTYPNYFCGVKNPGFTCFTRHI